MYVRVPSDLDRYIPFARYLLTHNTATELGMANGVEGTLVGIALDENEPDESIFY